MEERIQSLYETINFLGFNATYHRNNNYVENSKSLLPKIQEFAQWFFHECPVTFEQEVYDNFIDILSDCETALREHDHVLMLDALEQGISGYLEMFLSQDDTSEYSGIKEKETAHVERTQKQ